MDTTGAKDLGTSVKVPTTPYEDEQEQSLADLMEKLQREKQPGIEPEPWEPTDETQGIPALAYNLARLTDRVTDLEKHTGLVESAPAPEPEFDSFGIEREPEPLKTDVEHGLNDALGLPENPAASKRHWEARALEAEKMLSKAQGEASHHKRNIERLTAVVQAFIAEAGGESASDAELYNTDSGSVRYALNAVQQMRLNHDRLVDQLRTARDALGSWWLESPSKRVGDPGEAR